MLSTKQMSGERRLVYFFLVVIIGLATLYSFTIARTARRDTLSPRRV